MRVDLPDPLAPSRPLISPLLIVVETKLRARTEAKFLVTPDTLMDKSLRVLYNGLNKTVFVALLQVLSILAFLERGRKRHHVFKI